MFVRLPYRAIRGLRFHRASIWLMALTAPCLTMYGCFCTPRRPHKSDDIPAPASDTSFAHEPAIQRRSR